MLMYRNLGFSWAITRLQTRVVLRNPWGNTMTGSLPRITMGQDAPSTLTKDPLSLSGITDLGCAGGRSLALMEMTVIATAPGAKRICRIGNPR